MGKTKASPEVGNLFFFPNFIFYKLECTGGKSKNKKLFLKIEKKSSSRPFLAHPASGQEPIFYLRMALDTTLMIVWAKPVKRDVKIDQYVIISLSVFILLVFFFYHY